MADGTTRLGQLVGLEEHLTGTRIIATCTSCAAATEIDPTVALRASPIRLEEAIRCTCGTRRGRLGLATDAPPTRPGAHSCYLFHR